MSNFGDTIKTLTMGIISVVVVFSFVWGLSLLSFISK